MDNPDWKLQISQEALDETDPEIVAAGLAELVALLTTGGVEGLLAKSRKIVFVDGPLREHPCAVCNGPLTVDRQWADEYGCTATPECEKFTYTNDTELRDRLARRAQDT